ncbi:ATP-dependent DNA helicase PcrA [Chlamydiales bacterium SCGC AG-110-P3]|nr:ATP-dependent DNA helicase PcrA [Chlamydiales bacterium SCGC AG-110-P3]
MRQKEMVSSSLNGLNGPQRQAAETVDGRILILAGAGSGKTRVLTIRMAHLMINLDVKPEQILGVTFTNKAAAEMRQRLAKLVDPALAKRVTLSTFHSFCMKILRKEITALGYTPQFSLYDEQDVQRVVRMLAHDILDHDGQLPSLASTMAAISDAKNQGLAHNEIETGLSDWHDTFTQEIYRRLRTCMRAYNALDFDDLICLTVELFEKHPSVLARYQEQYRYLMIDEYQDTNPVQDKLTNLLSAKHGNVCVVGDDDQSIYGWRGAEVKNILRYQYDHRITLEQNYRSTNTILSAANAVIGNNSERHDKKMWSSGVDGESIQMFHAPDELKEAEAVAYSLDKMREELGLQWCNFAIMYRSNALSRQVELALLKYSWRDGDQWRQGIPYQVFGGTEFYERKEVKDLFAYLRTIVNSKDQEAILRIINQPRRGIGDAALDHLTQYNRVHGIPLWDVLTGVTGPNPALHELRKSISSRALNGLEDFVSVIESARLRFNQEPLSESTKWLIERVNYRKAIEEEVKSQQMREYKWENVEELVNSAGDYTTQAIEQGEEPSLHNFVSASPLRENRADKGKKEHANAVNLLTFHSSKGLEFPICYLVGIEDHIIPHEKSVMDTGVEEERRLMYVAMTRAMQRLVISMARSRKRMGKETPSKPSRFLYEIPKELLQMNKISS